MPTPAGKALEKAMRAQFDGLQANLDRKHEENRESWAFETRLTAVETKLVSIIGDNSGGSGLLHDIDKKVDTLSSEFAGIKKVLLFLSVIIPIILSVIGVIFLVLKH